MVGLAPKWVRLVPNGTNLGLFQIRFQYIWLDRAKCTEIWHEKAPDLSHLGPIWPTLEPNLLSLHPAKHCDEFTNRLVTRLWWPLFYTPPLTEMERVLSEYAPLFGSVVSFLSILPHFLLPSRHLAVQTTHCALPVNTSLPDHCIRFCSVRIIDFDLCSKGQ